MDETGSLSVDYDIWIAEVTRRVDKLNNYDDCVSHLDDVSEVDGPRGDWLGCDQVKLSLLDIFESIYVVDILQII